MRRSGSERLQRWAKRCLDVLASGAGLLCLSPLMAVTAVGVRLSLGRPVLFRQPRPGRGGRPFVLVKFRTMREAHDASGAPLPDVQRLTRTGRLLRALSLDELPQLWNVLRGDMSLVGPRPLCMEYLPRYSREQARRHEVLPGLTGWAQVHGRAALDWTERLRLDVWYVDHWSLALDLKILARTVGCVLRREGTSTGHETDFLGAAPEAVPGAVPVAAPTAAPRGAGPELIPLADAARWERACAGLPVRDVFYRHAYAQLCHESGDGDPFLFAYDDGAGGRLLYAFVRRELPDGSGHDLITPNRGYGGPLGAADARLLRGFREAFGELCRAQGFVSEFVRFHPVLGNHRLLAGPVGRGMDVRYDRETVLVDLRVGPAALLEGLHPSHRRNVRKAQGAGLGFEMLAGARAAPRLAAFYRLYCTTMDKVHAAAHSYFSLRYVQRLFELFGEDALLGVALLEGEPVAGAVYLREGGLLHYHLGGSDPARMRLGSNVFQFYRAAAWGAEAGCEQLHLGGGHVGRDALFEFKHRFAPTGLCDFYVGRKVHRPEAYARLVEAWTRAHGQAPPAQHFPAYRAPPPAPLAPEAEGPQQGAAV